MMPWKRWRWVIPAAWALMYYLIVDYTSAQSQAVEKRGKSLASMSDEHARMLEKLVNVNMSSLQALDILVSTKGFHHSKNYSAIDQLQMASARYAERTVFERPLMNGVAYGLRVNRTEREQFERQQGKKMYSSKTKKQSRGPRNAEKREPAAEYSPATARTSSPSTCYPAPTKPRKLGRLPPFKTTYMGLSPLRLGPHDQSEINRTVTTLNLGDPSRKHEMHRRFIQSPPWDWMAITSSIGPLVIALLIAVSIMASVGKLVIALLVAKRIANVEDDHEEMIVLKTLAEDADIAKLQAISSTVVLEQDEIVEERLDQAERKVEEEGMRSKLVTMANKKLTSVSTHSFPSRFCYLNKKVVSVGLVGLMVCILGIGAFGLPFNQSLGIRRLDENMMLNRFGWSHGRLLTATLHGEWPEGVVENSDMTIVGLRKMTANNDSSGQQQQQHWHSHISSKRQRGVIEMQNGAVKPHLLAYYNIPHKTMVGLWIALASATVLALGIAVWVLLWCRRSKRAQQNELELSEGMGPRRFQLCELVAATSNFADENKLGQGGFGPVYKGYLRNQDCHVAIKVLSKKQSCEQLSDEQGLREFKAEVKVMTQLRHRNIVNLVGLCECDGQQRLLLVYELMAQGSLDRHLHDVENILTWQQRYKILLGLGSALLYLHRYCKKCIVHGDIKPANVMLDAAYNAKLGDFGLARLVEHGEKPRTTQVVAGTPGYIDPEFIANRWPRTELDVYSFGVVLLEVACGKRPASRQPDGAPSLLAWVIRLYDLGTVLDAADHRLNGEFDQRQMERVLVTGLWCAHQDPVQRPSIEQAMDVLRSADAEMPLLRAVHDGRRHLRAMEEQAYADLPVEDRPVHAATASAYFTSKDSACLLAQE